MIISHSASSAGLAQALGSVDARQISIRRRVSREGGRVALSHGLSWEEGVPVSQMRRVVEEWMTCSGEELEITYQREASASSELRLVCEAFLADSSALDEVIAVRNLAEECLVGGQIITARATSAQLRAVCERVLEGCGGLAEATFPVTVSHATEALAEVVTGLLEGGALLPELPEILSVAADCLAAS